MPQENTPTIKVLHVTPDEVNMRIDQFFSCRYSDIPRAYFQRRIKAGDVLINETSCSCSDRLDEEDEVRIKWVSEEPGTLEPTEINFGVVFEDDDILVINKPAGVVVHPNEKHKNKTLVHGLLDYNEDVFRSMEDESRRPGIVHRLDKDTSGVMVVAKTWDAWHFLKQAFKERRVEKSYLAIVRDDVGEPYGEITAPLGRHPVNRQKRTVLTENGKYAKTSYRRLASNETASLLEVQIETGRTHQIRVHLSYINHSLLGDALYGGPMRVKEQHLPRQMLHAWKILFPHPRTGVCREYRAPIPDDFYNTLDLIELPLLGDR